MCAINQDSYPWTMAGVKLEIVCVLASMSTRSPGSALPLTPYILKEG